MLKEMGTGPVVTELMGQGVSGITGDYSRGAAGFWVENGEIQYPVSEITIAGNLKRCGVISSPSATILKRAVIFSVVQSCCRR